ncbi:MAG: transporter associated domain-containing protein [Pseudomonadota bacterium]
MADDNPDSSQRSFVGRIAQALGGEPRDRKELTEILTDAHERALLDGDSLSMINGVFEVADMQVRDVMIPRGQMVCVESDSPFSEILETVIESGHSRFPVVGESRDEMCGVLLAKDILKVVAAGTDFVMQDHLRKAVLTPESKRLNVLLRDFRNNRNHMAIVIDEYGGVAGLVTIEDVLEQIVGDIDDEHDTEEDANIREQGEQHYAVQALTPIEDVNDLLGLAFSDEEFDTIGGLVTHAFGRVPEAGESVALQGWEFAVVAADKRRIESLSVMPAAQPG